MPLSPHLPNVPQRQLYQLRPRNDLNDNWASDSTTAWSTISPSNPTSATTPTTSDILQSTSVSPTQISIPEPSPTSSIPLSSDGTSPLVFTTMIPVTTIAQPDTTITSFTGLLVTDGATPTSISSSSFLSSSTASAAFSSASLIESRSGPVCPGRGFDSAASGMLSVIIIPSVIGLILWILFAVLRPRFRQVYALREWFVQPDLRPKPLGSAFFAFLFPKVPLVPSVPSDVSDAGRSIAQDAKLFPSDEELSQRALWIALLIALGWSVIALLGALPLYIVDTPCNADYATSSVFGGGYSTLTDLSFLRLLRSVETGGITSDNISTGLQRRLADPIPESLHLRVRVIILTAFVIVLGVIPALWKIVKEFNRVAAYRRQWLEVKCEGKDLAWLSAKNAPGYATWGEKQLKDHLVKIGLSSTLGGTERQNGNATAGGARPRAGARTTRRREEEQPLNDKHEVETNGEVDIQSLFSIGDTHKIALLIEERDQILENLEISETKYINSFRVTTPDPSILDFVPPPPPADPNRPYISRPIPLAGQQQRKSRTRRHVNRAFASSSLAPTSFVAPSSYYKLRGVQGVSGGRFAETGADRHLSLTESINSRVIGSRFMEVNRNSVAYGRLPLGTNVAVEQSGELGPVDPRGSWMPSIPDPRLFGPNYGLTSYEDMEVDEHGVVRTVHEQEEAREWVDLSQEEEQFATDFNGIPPEQAGPSSFLRRPRPPKTDTTPPSTRRETFPRRETTYAVDPEAVPPPHLRLQPTQPFVRPLDGLGFEDLGHVYAEITQWRSRLKMINVEISEAQNQSYTDIAHGTNINGWLMVGRGLRFIPGTQMIEGRAKEDIRWDVLQNERSWLDTTVLWAVVIATMVILAAALTAAVGLFLAPSPNFAHYIPFLKPLLTGETVAAGIATILAPAIAATIFVILGIITIHWVTTIHGSVSVSGNQLLIFKITFFILTGVGALWLVAIGAILFSMQGISTNTEPTISVSNGAVYMSVLALALIINVAIIMPATLLLQPMRLWRVIRAEKAAVTPRQRFRAVYPRTYDPTYATGACVLALVFASTFALIFPLIAPAVVVLLLLTLIAQRFLVGYVYARTHSQTGGLLHMWMLQRFGTLLSLQPLLLGLICLALHFWEEGGVLIGTGVFVVIFMEGYTHWKMRLPSRDSLSPITINSLDTFVNGANTYHTDADSANGSTPPGTRTRGSMASVLEMMSVTLAVMPSASNYKGPVPLQTETLDDLTATERAARTHPDAPPRLPPLPFTDHAEDMAGILYAPELIAPPPIIWLPRDSANLAQSEAVDLQKYHDLQVTVDVRSKDDVTHLHRTPSSSRRPSR
ncbi:hypothetical protein HYPSUDRAFT_34085 [Hypholoma sublateritium FD-334 SS-4]|uniref:CSC1/OSCA1-like 7TM region domain-containing protein n=1 Tax=Hypholoma sublateritium (strain FD-334 SS-4) TaxID=945553 RepID=A0A0D2QAJ4_HYPSF|nr:hypothetical protein HYPSUDRAFT_34085 [Hypholoma sublateritium FD-334 SS-4]